MYYLVKLTYLFYERPCIFIFFVNCLFSHLPPLIIEVFTFSAFLSLFILGTLIFYNICYKYFFSNLTWTFQSLFKWKFRCFHFLWTKQPFHLYNLLLIPVLKLSPSLHKRKKKNRKKNGNSYVSSRHPVLLSRYLVNHWYDLHQSHGCPSQCPYLRRWKLSTAISDVRYCYFTLRYPHECGFLFIWTIHFQWYVCLFSSRKYIVYWQLLGSIFHFLQAASYYFDDVKLFWLIISTTILPFFVYKVG